MALIGVTSRGILIKLVLFYSIFFLDMFFTSFVEFSLKTDLSDGVDKYTVFALLAYVFFYYYLLICFRIQLATTFLLMAGFFVLMWSTFLLRFGLLGILLKNFKWTLATFLFYSIFFIAERVWRMVLKLIIFSFNLNFFIF